ncbi:SIS domain-containing protein [Sphingosinicella sp. LHD-64]|uniref:SIS domain-containing protein n=1 Tax=Sphingosinicella sp. LHD-64 TaxID=3072139 RepID=UPI00281031C7|nr:SIS domain-containing protein [Sphingosinicella sp. LHD-64]MDQ8756924.1 SIS domain-containing protein [Sphingosinicella sp. LHD-64]
MIDPAKTRMWTEACEAHVAVATQLAANRDAVAALADRLRDDPPRAVMTCARGSSDHAATFAKYLIETRLGIPTASAAPSVASVYGAPSAAEGMLCIAISQSGRSPDLIATVEAAKRGGALAVALVNDPGSPLAAAADHVLPLHAAPETSVAATKSFIASLAAVASLAAAWAGDESLDEALSATPNLLARAWDCDWAPLTDRLAGARGLYVIGRGLGLGVAQEAALKLKETCGLHAEAFSAAELRHGPMALVGPDLPLLVFRQSDETEESVDELICDVAARGAEVFVTGTDALPSVRHDPVLEPMLQIQSFYRAAVTLSVRRGFDPDHPPHLAKVTETV